MDPARSSAATREPEGRCLVAIVSLEAGSRERGLHVGQPTLSSLSTECQLCTQIPGPLRTALWGVMGC